MPVGFGYIANFLGQQPEEDKKPQKDDPRINLPPEVLQQMGFLRQPTGQELAERKRLAELLGLPWRDLLADLDITIEIKRFPRHRRFLKYIPKWLN